jgi:hypothetical protein
MTFDYWVQLLNQQVSRARESSPNLRRKPPGIWRQGLWIGVQNGLCAGITKGLNRATDTLRK